MPLTDTRSINDHTLLGLWEISETVPELLEMFRNLRPNQPVMAYKNEIRQKEWLASRILAYRLLQHFTTHHHEITSDENGKPQFQGTAYQVSISQSAGRVAVILSDRYEVGIDIEITREKIMRLKTKFLSETELAQAGENLNIICLYWSAKETLYKLYGRKQVLFIENLQVGPVIDERQGELQAQISLNNFSRSCPVQYEQLGNFMLTYCIYNPEN